MCVDCLRPAAILFAAQLRGPLSLTGTPPSHPFPAVYLFTHTSSRTGKRLDASTIDQYMHKAMDVFRSKFGHAAGTAANREFFKAIDENPGVNWFAKLNEEVEDKDKKLKRERGEPLLDSKSPALLLATHLECMDQLSLMNTKNSITDRFVMAAQRSLCNRASDTRDTLWEDVKVDKYLPLERFVVEDWQVKVCDQKPVPLLPSNDDPRLSFTLALGDSLCVGGANEQCSLNTPTKHHLFPELALKRGGAAKNISVRSAHACALPAPTDPLSLTHAHTLHSQW